MQRVVSILHFCFLVARWYELLTLYTISKQLHHGTFAQTLQDNYKRFLNSEIPSLPAAICDGLIYFELERDF